MDPDFYNYFIFPKYLMLFECFEKLQRFLVSFFLSVTDAFPNEILTNILINRNITVLIRRYGGFRKLTYWDPGTVPIFL